MKIAIITARGGSKRIPRKNIREFCGKPIIAYSIEAALMSGCFDEIMVSTDDFEIAEISKKWGAKVPFMRSAETANDSAVTADVIVEVLGEYQKRGVHAEMVCCIYPTAPFITPHELQAAYNILLQNPHINAVNPIVRFSYPIQRALRLKDGLISMFQPEHLLSLSQNLEPGYHDAGQFYWVRVNEFLKSPLLMGPNTAGLVLPEWQVQDIDHEDDWILAEMKYRFIQERKASKQEVA